jgi:hypothetical protein
LKISSIFEANHQQAKIMRQIAEKIKQNQIKIKRQ